MNKIVILVILTCSIILMATPSVASTNRVKIEIPSVGEEIEYVWRTLQDIPFFVNHGYDISLPEHSIMDLLVEKAKRAELTRKDRDSLDRLMRNDIYDRKLYELAYAKIKSRQAHINQLINRLDRLDKNWNYQSFETYQVRLTLYGPGGSYDPSNGSILIFATPSGSFKQYKDPACTIIHEVVHIGIEESIVSQLSLPHVLKERVVDRIVEMNFEKELPEYRVQNMGYAEFDDYFRDLSDFKELNKVLKKFLDTKMKSTGN